MDKVKKSSEFKHFNSLAEEWWNESGKYNVLHEITPIRVKYILNSLKAKKIEKLNVLDLGCGGGLVCEPLARLGCNVTGIDFVEKNIQAAKLHSKQNNLKIEYLVQDLANINIKKKYDLVIIFEVLEHISNWDQTITSIKKILNKNGILIISTINRNIISNFFAIKLAENFLKWIPKKTHNYNKLIKPEELKKCLIRKNYSILDFSGLVYNPISREWKLSKYNKLINYFCAAKLN